MGSVIDKNPYLRDFANEFAKDFTDSFTKHYAKAHKAAWPETLKKAVEFTKTLTRREVASCLIKYTELTHGATTPTPESFLAVTCRIFS
ncbi:MAG: hypothetical protein IJT58_03215 [Synergistaceae bacterium]|nr:hypothetical protein [Synergistaceae bacterium]